MPIESGIPVLSGYDVQDESMIAFTVEDAIRLRIDQASVRNYGAVESVLSIWLIQSTQGEGELTLANDITLAAGEATSIASAIGRTLSVGGTIRLKSSVANTLTVSVTGTNYL